MTFAYILAYFVGFRDFFAGAISCSIFGMLLIKIRVIYTIESRCSVNKATCTIGDVIPWERIRPYIVRRTCSICSNSSYVG